jgi:hypothetical protein
VDLRDDSDYESGFCLDRVFASEDAANEYATQFLAPTVTRVYPMTVLPSAPQIITNYEFHHIVPIDPDHPDWQFHRDFYPTFDAAQAEPDVTQFSIEDLDATRTLDPVTTSVEVHEDQNAIDITVRGADRGAVQEAFVAAYADACAAQRPSVGEGS